MDNKEQKLQQLLSQTAKEISGTIGISIVDIASGIALSTYSSVAGFDLNVAAAYNAEVVKQKFKAMQALGLKNEMVNEMIITLSSQTHVIKLINNEYMIYFAFDSSTSNMGLARTVLNSMLPKMKDII